MKTRLSILLLVSLSVFPFQTGSCQIPDWIIPGKELSPSLGVSGFYQTSESVFDHEGNRYQVGDFQHWSLSADVWFPVTEQVVIYGQVPVWQVYSAGGNTKVPEGHSSGIGDPVIGLAYLLQSSSMVLCLAGDMTLPVASTGRFDNPVPLGSGELKYALSVRLTSAPGNGSWIWTITAGGVRRDLNRNHEGRTGGHLYYPLGKLTLIGVELDYRFPIGKIESTDPAINGLGNGVSGLTVSPGSRIALPNGYAIQFQVQLPVTGGNRPAGTRWMTRLLVPI